MTLAKQQQLPFLHRRTTRNWVSVGSTQPQAVPVQPVVVASAVVARSTGRHNAATAMQAMVVAAARTEAPAMVRAGHSFAAARFAHALELCGACMLIAMFLGVALFG